MTQETKSVLIQFKGEATNLLQTQSKVTQETKKLANEFQKVGKANKNFGNQFQNIGYQVQDFAVQVSGGTDAMRAFSQQAPQLLSPLGNIGIAAATAVAVLVPLAKTLFDNADASKKAASALDDFDKSLSDISGGDGSLDKFIAALKEANDIQRKLLSAEAGIASNALQVALDEANKSFERQIQLATQWNAVVTGGFINFAAVYDQIASIQDNLKVDKETATAISDVFKAFKDGSKDLDELKLILLELEKNGKVSADAIKPLKDALNEVITATKSLSNVNEKLDSIGKVKPELTGVDDLLESISYSLIEGIDGWANWGKAALEAANPDPFEVLMNELGEVMRTADATAEAIASLGNLKDIGVEFGKAPKKNGEEIKTLLQELQTEAGKWADQFADTLVSGLAEGKLAFKDFANYVLQQLARIAISKALEPLFNSFGNWIGGITGASAAPAGLVATPASAMPLSREMATVQPMVVGVPRMSAPVKSNSPVTVNVINQGSNEVEVNERKTTRGIEVDVLIKNAVKKGIAAGDFDKVMATSYGARRLAF